MHSRIVEINLLNLLDGSPHEVPIQKVLLLDVDPGDQYITSHQVSSSRVALWIQSFRSAVVKKHKELVVWDWRTGEMVCCFDFFFQAGVSSKAPTRCFGARTMTRASAT